MVTIARARIIAHSWHDGQLSALYQFASSGIYEIENHLKYLQEIELSLNSELKPEPYHLSKIQASELKKLKSYLLKQGEKNGIKTNWKTHPKFKNGIPFVDAKTPAELLKKIHQVRYPD